VIQEKKNVNKIIAPPPPQKKKHHTLIIMTVITLNSAKTECLTVFFYEGGSNENLKGMIIIWNTAQLSCKLIIMILMVWRVADRWQYDSGMQHNSAVVV